MPAYDITAASESGLAPGERRYYRVRAWNDARFSDYSAVVSGTTLSAFAQWNVDEGLAANTPATADPDRDGLPQLAEFALGRDPRVADSVDAVLPQIIGNAPHAFLLPRTGRRALCGGDFARSRDVDDRGRASGQRTVPGRVGAHRG